MGMGFYLVAEKQVEGIKGTAMDGKALVRNQEILDARAAVRSLPNLASFLSFNPEELATWAESIGASADGTDIPPEQWFSPSELLTTANALSEDVKQDPSRFVLPDSLQQDLSDLIRMLDIAVKNKVRVHLTMDQP